MEFNKFKTTGGGPSSYNPPPPQPHSSSGLSYFAEQALRVGYTRPDLARIGDHFPYHMNLPENIIREIEKQKIREEMIAAEVEWRHQLEAEVKREMMIEREMALRSGHPRDLPFFLGPSEMLMNSRLPILNYPENRFADPLPFSRKSEVRISEVKASPVVNKERITILPRPEGSISGIKRKVITTPATNAAMPLSDPNKKTKLTLCCELCQVSATSELALKEHFQGRKHKSREARQSTQIAGKNFSIGLFSRKAVTNDESLVLEKKPKEEVLENSIEEQKDDLPLQKSENSNNIKNDEVAKPKKDSLKFAFWCEMCKIGAFSKKVMNAHMRGKKHTSRVYENLGTKNENASETVIENKITEANPDRVQIEKPAVEDGGKGENGKSQDANDLVMENGNEKEKHQDADETAVSSVSDRAVAPFLLGWIA